MEITKAHATLCSEAKDQAVKDNELIYHDILPSEPSLPTIEKLPAATPITIQEVYQNADVSKLIGPDIFVRLVPLAVHESASVYSEEKAKLVRGEVERVDLSEGEVRAGLEHLGFPGLVNVWRKIADDEDGDGEVEVSGSLRRLADDVQRERQVESLLRGLDTERERCERVLRELNGLLDNESRECERMRVCSGTSLALDWLADFRPSTTHNSPNLHQDLRHRILETLYPPILARCQLRRCLMPN